MGAESGLVLVLAILVICFLVFFSCFALSDLSNFNE